MLGFGTLFQNFGDLLKFVQDEHFRKFLADPRVQELMKDDEFKKAVQGKNFFRLMSHSKFADLLKDPELRATLEEWAKKFQKSV